MTRERGTIVSAHDSLNPYGGQYGQLRREDGKIFTWDNRNAYLDGTHTAVGLDVTFEAIDYIYATHISSREGRLTGKDYSVEVKCDRCQKNNIPVRRHVIARIGQMAVWMCDLCWEREQADPHGHRELSNR
jgi:hypothetical protein